MKYPESNGQVETVGGLTEEYGGKKNNWVPICKNFVYYLPIDRPYTELEAMYSYTVDLDNNTLKSERSYARIWRWSRTKVKKFLEDIEKPESGHKPYQLRATSQPPVFIINKHLWKQKSQKRANFEPEKSHLAATTTHPNPNPNPKKTNSGKIDLPPDLDCDSFHLAFGEFVKHRKSMKGGFTDRARALIVKEVQKLSNGDVQTAIAILEQSIMRGWKGVFPLAEHKAKNSNDGGLLIT